MKMGLHWKYYRKLIYIYGQHNRSSENTNNRIVERFQPTGSIEDEKVEIYSRSLRSQENIDLVHVSVM